MKTLVVLVVVILIISTTINYAIWKLSDRDEDSRGYYCFVQGSGPLMSFHGEHTKDEKFNAMMECKKIHRKAQQLKYKGYYGH